MFVVEEKTFVAGVHVNGSQLTSGICANSPHEAERLSDGRHNFGVLDLKLGIMNVAKAPIERSMEICNAGRERCSNEIQCGCGVEVCAAFVNETTGANKGGKLLPDEP